MLFCYLGTFSAIPTLINCDSCLYWKWELIWHTKKECGSAIQMLMFKNEYHAVMLKMRTIWQKGMWLQEKWSCPRLSILLLMLKRIIRLFIANNCILLHDELNQRCKISHWFTIALKIVPVSCTLESCLNLCNRKYPEQSALHNFPMIWTLKSNLKRYDSDWGLNHPGILIKNSIWNWKYCFDVFILSHLWGEYLESSLFHYEKGSNANETKIFSSKNW